MEDFFQILIWLLIIISFFSGFFKKKEKPAPPKQAPKRPESSMDYETGTLESEQTQQDIFKEIENLFKGETVERTSEPARVEQVEKKKEGLEKRTYESTTLEKAKDHYKNDSWHEPTYSEHTFENKWDREKEKVLRKQRQVDSSTEKQAKKFEEMLAQEAEHDNFARKYISRQLRNPDSVREYIIFSEIIGKPKALKR